MRPKVIIDGIEYAPVSESNPSAKQIAIALIERYMGKFDEARWEELAHELQVCVSEDMKEPTVMETVGEILKATMSTPTQKSSMLDSIAPEFTMTRRMRDWMDLHGVPKSQSVRFGLLRVAKLAEDGLTLEQIKQHRMVKQKRSIRGLVDDFFAKWTSR